MVKLSIWDGKVLILVCTERMEYRSTYRETFQVQRLMQMRGTRTGLLVARFPWYRDDCGIYIMQL